MNTKVFAQRYVFFTTKMVSIYINVSDDNYFLLKDALYHEAQVQRARH